MSSSNVTAISTLSNKGTVAADTGSLSFTGKNTYGGGTVDGGDPGAWKSGGTDISNFVSGMQTFIGVDPDGGAESYSAGALNGNLLTLGVARVDVSSLTESNMELLVGDLTKSEILSGGSGTDFIYGSDTNGDTITTGAGSLNFVAARGGADTITGGTGTDFISAGTGNDTINSGDERDFVTTDDINVADGTIKSLTNSGENNAGDDDIDLGAGDDFVAVGANLQSTDEVDGGTGTDYVVFDGDYATTPLTLGATTLTNVEYFILESGNDYDITLHDGTFTTSGAVTINGGGLGSGDNVTIDATAETTADITMISSEGADTLTGGGGNDVFQAHNGNDTLRGNGGADYFRFLSKNHGTDTIADFTSGTDKIVLNSSAHFSGLETTGTPAVDSGELRAAAGATTAADADDFLIYNTTNGALYFDQDADVGSYSPVRIATLTDAPTIDESDFSLAALT